MINIELIEFLYFTLILNDAFVILVLLFIFRKELRK